MSYKQAVLRDDPISYWPLDGQSTLRTYATLLLEYATYQDYLNNESTYNQEVGSITIQDVSNFGNHGAFTLGSPNFQDVTTLINHASYDTNYSGCKITENISVDILNVYNAFQGGYEKKAFGIEFWTLLDSAPTSDMNLVDLHSGSNKRMRIYANQDSLYFQVYFSDGSSQTTVKQIHSWDSPIHIFAYVKDGVQQIYVNGLSDESLVVPTSKSYYADSLSRFGVGPSYLGSTFIINGLAFYDRVLSVKEIQNHMYWAQRDSNPINYAKQTNVSHFPFDKTSGRVIMSKYFADSSAFNTGSYTNLISDKTGITIQQSNISGEVTGTWTYPVLLTSYSNFAGVEISWDSASTDNSSVIAGKYVVVDVSYDNGINYYRVTNKKSIPYIITSYANVLSVQVLIRVTIYSPDVTLSNQPRLDNLRFTAYSDISEISDSGLFQIYPYSSTTYMIRQDSQNILSRAKNLGITFSAQDPGGVPGSALINSSSSSAYQSIEFWFSYNGAGSAILDSDSSTNIVDLYIDNSNMLQNNISGSTLYVNGISRNASPITLTNGEVYHVILVYPSSKTSTILLNGDYSGSKTSCEATYGYITIYPTSLTQSQAQTRYLSYLEVQTGYARDYTTSMGSVIEYSGTSANINNGQPVAYHRHLDQNGS